VTLFVRRAGALILVLEACYLLLMELALAVFVVDTSEIDHTDAGGTAASAASSSSPPKG
jgi:hypothetical protein